MFIVDGDVTERDITRVSVPSSELAPPNPLPRMRVCLPPWTQRGGDNTLLRMRWWGDSIWMIRKKARHSVNSVVCGGGGG